MVKKFTFQPKHTDFPAFQAKSSKELFQKWGMAKMIIAKYRYDNYCSVDDIEEFVECLFKDTHVQRTLDSSRPFTMFSKCFVELVPSTTTSLAIFDKLYSSSLVRDCGDITKCFDVMVNDILVSDELRKMILSEESEFYDLYSKEERNEFIFHVFQHLVLGGYCNQYEDNVKPYVELTKYLYKDILYVYKDRMTQLLKIGSEVICVTFSDDDDNYVFPGKSKHIQNFCYVILNAEKREVIIWVHEWDL